MTGKAAALGLTGERTLPGIWHENYWFRRHEAVYRWLLLPIAQIAHGAHRIVLDAGCGEGYGAALLAAGGAGTVVGLDYDARAVAHVRASYPRTQVVRSNLVALPFADASVGGVVSLQTIEHLWDQPAFVAESVRVLRPGGLLAISTPNRRTFSPGVPRGAKPLNPFHVNEFDAEELLGLVAAYAPVEALLGVHEGPRLRAWRQAHGDVVAAQLSRPYDEWAADLVALVAGLTAADFVVGPDDIDASLDLVVLARAG